MRSHKLLFASNNEMQLTLASGAIFDSVGREKCEAQTSKRPYSDPMTRDVPEQERLARTLVEAQNAPDQLVLESLQ